MKNGLACGTLRRRELMERGLCLERNQKHPMAAVAVVLAVCLMAAGLLGLLSACRNRNEPVAVCGEFSLSNTELGYYYWSEYFYLAGAYGDYLDGMVDLSQPLDQQAYSEDQTWQDYLLEEALDVMRDTMSMVFRAEETGFTLPEDYQASYETVLSNFEAAAEQGGYDTVDGYLQASYGEDANWESFSRYLYNAHLAAAYSDFLYAAIDPTEQEVAAYFSRYAGEYYENYGVTQDDGPMAEAVVLSFETEQEARQVYDEYLENGGGEEVLINLGNIYCGENGYVSAAMPGQFSEETEAWLCGEDRQAGDCAVIPEDGGASVAFYVGSSGQFYWQILAREDLCRETYQNEYRAICGSYTFLVNYDQIHIIPPEGLYEA